MGRGSAKKSGVTPLWVVSHPQVAVNGPLFGYILWADGTDLRSLPLDERRRRLQGFLPKGSPLVSEAPSVAGRGRELFELMCTNDLEGVTAKRLTDPFESRIRWLKIKNPDYSQKEGGRPVQRAAAADCAYGRLVVEIKRLVPSPRGGSRPRLCENTGIQSAHRKSFLISSV